MADIMLISPAVLTPAAVAAAGSVSTASPAVDTWNSFYATRIEAAYRLIGAFLVIFAVLYFASGLFSRLFVKVGAVEWNRGPLLLTGWLGMALIFAASALLPIYAMFNPFEPPGVVHIAAWVVLASLFAVVFALFLWSQRSPPGRPRGKALALKTWRMFLGAFTVVFVAGVVPWFFGLDHATPRLAIAYVEMAALGVITTSASYGQHCRIQVEAKSCKGKRDAAATEYLLARFETLGLEQPRGMHIARPSKAMAELASSDLSATPTGQIASTIARIMFAARPGLTWRVSVAFVDASRLAMTLSRNGRLVGAEVLARQDIGLGEMVDAEPDSLARARAQLLTGACAFVLLYLSQVYPRLEDGLRGAENWRSVTLQVIASSRSLSGHDLPGP